ncbi:hypothetical protein FE257_008542 [Aspergillus nanangensis]|uniref:Major facilitator superfamily (MFS) profile domain-containing protein n=1 Tax=Aspergillus nanangensis TaxID=2582783 RepID=A0AAD4GTG4_ASPNN|nr:hypothetical protein FE257_008542 [Aspergillus nanangensis]
MTTHPIAIPGCQEDPVKSPERQYGSIRKTSSSDGWHQSDKMVREGYTLVKLADNRFLVEFENGSSKNPYNWAFSKKLYIAIITFFTILSGGISSALPSNAVDSIMEEFAVEGELNRVLPAAVFLIGYIVGPLVFSPLSETIGRKPVLFWTFSMSVLASLGCAVAPDWPSFLVLRWIWGTGAAAPQTVVGGVYADMFADSKTRGRMIACYITASSCGPILGPILSGCVIPEDWRWCFRIVTICFGLIWFGLIFISETFGPALLKQEVNELRKLSGSDAFLTRQEMHSSGFRTEARRIITRPMSMLVFEPVVLFCSIYIAYAFGLIFFSFQAFPIIFKGVYNFTVQSTSLCFIAVGIGAISAGPVAFYWDTVYENAKSKGDVWAKRPEMQRLPIGCVGGPCLAISLFWLAWTAQSHIHWIVPVLAGVFFGLGYQLMFISLQSYIADVYRVYAASAMAASVILRSIVGAVLPLAATPLYESLGVGWGTSVIGLASLACVPIPFVFLSVGPWMRKKTAPAEMPASEPGRLPRCIATFSASSQPHNWLELKRTTSEKADDSIAVLFISSCPKAALRVSSLKVQAINHYTSHSLDRSGSSLSMSDDSGSSSTPPQTTTAAMTTTTTMTLLELPTELLLTIWGLLEKEYDMNRFVCTCRQLYHDFNGLLYRHNVCHGGQAITWAAEQGQDKTLTRLLDEGAAQIITYDEWPLFTAAEHGKLAIIQLLVHTCNPIDMKDDKESMAMFYAAKGNHVPVMEWFLEKGIDFHWKNINGETALTWAVEFHSLEAVQLLLSRGADPEHFTGSYTLLIEATKNGDLEIVQELLKKTQQLDFRDTRYGETALMWAAECNEEETFQTLLAAGADITIVDNNDLTALSWAVKTGSETMVRLLLERGADANVSADGTKPCIGHAAAFNQLTIVKLLVEHHADPERPETSKQQTPLSLAASHANDEVVRFLLEQATVDINARDESKMTPLTWAAKKGFTTVTTTLLAKGASPDTIDTTGYSPLSWASRGGYHEVAALLLQHDVNVNTADQYGQTPLIIATLNNHVEIVELLMKKGADPSITDESCRTPLLVAAQYGYTKVALALLADGTPPDTWTSRTHRVIVPTQPDNDSNPTTPPRPPPTTTATTTTTTCPSGSHIRSGRGRWIDTPDKNNRTPLFFATLHGHEDMVRILLCRGSSAIETPTKAGRTPRSIVAGYKDAALKMQNPRLQFIWQWFRFPGEASVDMKLVRENIEMAQNKTESYPWCDGCDTPFFPYDYMLHLFG